MGSVKHQCRDQDCIPVHSAVSSPQRCLQHELHQTLSTVSCPPQQCLLAPDHGKSFQMPSLWSLRPWCTYCFAQALSAGHVLHVHEWVAEELLEGDALQGVPFQEALKKIPALLGKPGPVGQLREERDAIGSSTSVTFSWLRSAHWTPL